MKSPIPPVPGRSLRILMIAPTSFFSDYGGHIRILEETKALQNLGHEVTIVTYYKGSDMPGLEIRRTAPLPWHTEYEVGSSRHKLAFDVYLAVQSLIEGYRFRPDIIHGHMHEGALIGGLLARLLRVPIVFDFQGSLTAEMVDHQFLDPNGRLFRWVYRAERFIDQRLPSAILTSSVQAGRMLQADFQVNPEIIKPLPDCADTERFRPDLLAPGASKNLRLALGIPEDRLIVAYLGLLTDYQGIPQLIETAAKLNQTGDAIHFLVMGYPNVDLYRGLADSAGVGDRMTFTGKIEYRDAATYLGLGDIAVAPKMSTSEGSGKLLNYMAMAQPVVAFDTPVHREYLAELGIYDPVGNTSAFAAAIRQLMNNPGQRASLGQQLRQRAADHYSWREAGQEIEQIYSQLTS